MIRVIFVVFAFLAFSGCSSEQKLDKPAQEGLKQHPMDTFTLAPYQVVVDSVKVNKDYLVMWIGLRLVGNSYPVPTEWYLVGTMPNTENVVYWPEDDCKLKPIVERENTDLWLATIEASKRYSEGKQVRFFELTK